MKLSAMLIAGSASYAAAAFLTFGVAYNECAQSNQTPYSYSVCRLGAGMTGVVWPIYWAGRGAIEVTKP